MKIPEKPPSIAEIIKNPTFVLNAFRNEDLTKAIVKLNNDKEYHCWDKFKYLQWPDGITPEMAWSVRELQSGIEKKQLPVKNKNGDMFRYWLPPRAQEWLHMIDREIPFETLNTTENLKTDKERYILSSLREEAISSSQMEGAATTRKKAKDMLLSGQLPKNHAEQMIYNNYNAIAKIKEIKNEELSIERIIEIHKILTYNTMPEASNCGHLRSSEQDDEVKIYDTQGTLLHEPPKHENVLPLLTQLIIFANTDSNEYFVHPAIKAITIHFWLSYIHPFLDGNGRTARALFYWYMLKKGYWMFEYVSISRIVLKTYGQYIQAFLHSELTDDLTYFIMYNLRVIHDATRETALYINKKQKEKNAAINFFKIPNINLRQQQLLAYLIKHPDAHITINNHTAFHKVVYQTARADLLGIVKYGFMEQLKIGKKFIFIAAPELSVKIQTVLSENKKYLRA